MSNLLFHLGLHKTGTTTLQRLIFPSWTGLRCLSEEPEVEEFVRATVLNDVIYFNPEYWRTRLAHLTNLSNVTVMSNESFSGALYAGVGKRGLDHRLPILQNIHATFPEAKVLLVVRRQDTLARSLYRQYLKVGGTETINDFYGAQARRSPIFPLERFNFGPYIDKLHELFPSRVLVLSYEDFATQQELFLSRLGKFLGQVAPQRNFPRSNETRLGSRGLEISRLSNHLFRSRLNPGGLLPGVPVYRKGRIRLVSLSSIIHNRWPKMPVGARSGTSRIDRVCEEILTAQRANNAILDKKYGLDLQSHGYY